MIQFFFLLALVSAKPLDNNFVDHGYAYRFFGKPTQFTTVQQHQPYVATTGFAAVPSFYSSFPRVSHVSTPVVNRVNVQPAAFVQSQPTVYTAVRPVVQAIHAVPVVRAFPHVQHVVTPVVRESQYPVENTQVVPPPKPQVRFGLPPVEINPIPVRTEPQDDIHVVHAAEPAVVSQPEPAFRNINFPAHVPVARPTYYSRVQVDDSAEDGEFPVFRSGSASARSFRYDDDSSEQEIVVQSPKVNALQPQVTAYSSSYRQESRPTFTYYSAGDETDSEEEKDAPTFYRAGTAFRSASPVASVYTASEGSDEDDDQQYYRFGSPAVATFRSAFNPRPIRTESVEVEDFDFDRKKRSIFDDDDDRENLVLFKSADGETVAVPADDDDDDDDDDKEVVVVSEGEAPSVAQFRSAGGDVVVVSSDEDDNDDDEEKVVVVAQAKGETPTVAQFRSAGAQTVILKEQDDDDKDEVVLLKSANGETVAVQEVDDDDDDEDEDTPVIVYRQKRSDDEDKEDDDNENTPSFRSAGIPPEPEEDDKDDDDDK